MRFVEITEYQCAVWHSLMIHLEMQPEAKALTQKTGVLWSISACCVGGGVDLSCDGSAYLHVQLLGNPCAHGVKNDPLRICDNDIVGIHDM